MPYFWPAFLFQSLLRLAKVSVVIINFNGRKYLEKFLPSVLAGTYYNMELIVADNASTDDSLEFLRRTYPAIRIIELKRNHGYAGGYNEALKEVQSDYYVLLNSDVEVRPGWIEPVIELMEKDQGIGACQPKILSYNQKRIILNMRAQPVAGWIVWDIHLHAAGFLISAKWMKVSIMIHAKFSGQVARHFLSGPNYFIRPADWIHIFLRTWRR